MVKLWQDLIFFLPGSHLLIGVQHVCCQRLATSLRKHRLIVSYVSPLLPILAQYWNQKFNGESYSHRMPATELQGQPDLFTSATNNASTLLPLALPPITVAIACADGTTNPLMWFLRESSCLASCLRTPGSPIAYTCVWNQTPWPVCVDQGWYKKALSILGEFLYHHKREDSLIKEN